MLKAVTFDFWGTLYEEYPLRQRRMDLRHDYALGFFLGLGAQVTPKQLEYAFQILFHDIERLRQVQHAGVPGDELGRRLARVVGIELEDADAARLGELLSSAGRKEPPTPVEGAKAVLSALRGRVKLGLISDTGVTLGHDTGPSLSCQAAWATPTLTRYRRPMLWKNNLSKGLSREGARPCHLRWC